MRAESWSRRRRRSTVRSGSTTGASGAAACMRFARGFSVWSRFITFICSVPEEVAGEFAALAALDALAARLADLHDLGRQLHAVLPGGRVNRARSAHLRRRALALLRLLGRALRTGRRS